MRHNEVLGVAHGAGASEIQSASRRAAMDVHPDHSNSPEAAEAFRRIKEARDKLLAEAKLHEHSNDAASIQQVTAAAVKATTNAAYATPVTDDMFAGMTPEEIAHVQMLDDLVYRTSKQLFRREDDEIAKHRRTLKTGKARISGKY